MSEAQGKRELEWAMRKVGVVTLNDQPVIIQDSNMWLRLAKGQPPRWFWSEYEAKRG